MPSPPVYCRNMVEVLAGFRLVMSKLRNWPNPLDYFGRQNDYDELSHNRSYFALTTVTKGSGISSLFS